MSPNVKTIGLTGGIGSGKSTVATILEELGAVVIHADTVGHEVYGPNTEGWRQVTEAFGTQILGPDQAVDRKQLGAIVFNDPEARQRLNAIVHPLIFEEVQRRITSYRHAGVTQPLVVEAAVLIEANWLPLVDEVWLVTANRQDVMERVRAERGLSAAEATARIDAQLTDAERKRFAQVIIENTGSLGELRQRVRAVWDCLLAAAR